MLNLTSLEEWMSKARAPALDHTMKLFNDLKKRGVQIKEWMSKARAPALDHTMKLFND